MKEQVAIAIAVYLPLTDKGAVSLLRTIACSLHLILKLCHHRTPLIPCSYTLDYNSVDSVLC